MLLFAGTFNCITLPVNSGCEEGWYSFYGPISLHRKWNNVCLAWSMWIFNFFSFSCKCCSYLFLICCNLQVVETSGANVNCLVKNAATLAGPIFTLHVSQVHISLPTLSEYDKHVMGAIFKFFLHNIEFYIVNIAFYFTCFLSKLHIVLVTYFEQ